MSETNENYDRIEIAIRDIIEITIPSFIKIIGSYAFEHCHKLQRIDIPSNSELQTIEEYAFNYSSIKSIFIPPHVTKICKYAFYQCTQLQQIDIPSNSELQIIEENAFRDALIKSIFIPPHVTKICKNAFYFCSQLQRIDIPSNSELQTIEENAFNCSLIESIFIPARVIDLKEGWCINMKKLTNIEVDPRNSRYFNYEGKMIISKTSETNENYDKIEIVKREIIKITIPPFIKTIGSYAFEHCKKLQRIDIPSNSELQTIEEYALFSSSIKSIFIPPHVTKICKYSFDNCKQLRQIDIQLNSELQIIEKKCIQKFIKKCNYYDSCSKMRFFH